MRLKSCSQRHVYMVSYFFSEYINYEKFSVTNAKRDLITDSDVKSSAKHFRLKFETLDYGNFEKKERGSCRKCQLFFEEFKYLPEKPSKIFFSFCNANK